MNGKPSGVITLTTDFGHKGPFAAAMKGVMLTRFPAVRIVDLTHEIVPHWPAEAGFWMERAYRFFPLGTVHLAVVDPGVGTDRSILVVEFDGHVFVAPDNGLLADLSECEGSVCRRVDLEVVSQFMPAEISATFHGRDIFAPLGAAIASGDLMVSKVGPVVREVVPSWVEKATVSANEINGTVITTDNFGNLITNVLAKDLKDASYHVMVGGRRIPLRRTYGDVSPGDYLALLNSFGVVEIARAEHNAAESLGVGRGAPVKLIAT